MAFFRSPGIELLYSGDAITNASLASRCGHAAECATFEALPKATSTTTIEATIASLAPGGAGVAHFDHPSGRRAVFVAHAAPGDRVRLSVDLSTRPARGEIREVVSSGPDRVVPACPWSTRCGGCDWMHLSPEAQARAHADHVRDALPRAWGPVSVDVRAAPRGLGYRSRARVHVRCGRGGRAIVGMHGARTREPVEVEACAVLHPALELARARVAAFFAGCSGRGDVQIALGEGGLPVYDVRWSGEVGPATFGRLERAIAAGDLAGARIAAADAKRPATIGDAAPQAAGADGKPLRLAPGGFGQANDEVNVALARHVASLAHEARPRRAVELYAGAGNLSVVLAPEVGELTCVESSHEACEAARANLAARSQPVRVVEGDADTFAWKPSTDLVVLDPPRKGARAACGRLAQSRVSNVLYVSCDAQTLGRDLAVLAPAYAPRSVTTFEMFPQTSHVEVVVAMERRRG
jgi:23S rRNA (uracil1939-C5)-methyltransferase